MQITYGIENIETPRSALDILETTESDIDDKHCDEHRDGKSFMISSSVDFFFSEVP